MRFDLPLQERDEIRFESYCRIEHVLTGFWLHALKGTRTCIEQADTINVVLCAIH